MIFPKDFESKIGFGSIRELISDYCETRPGREEVSKMKFSTDYNLLKSELHRIVEMKTILESSESIPDENIKDVMPFLKELTVRGMVISAENFYKLSQTLHAFELIRDFFKKKGEGDNITYPYLYSSFHEIPVFPEMVKEIDRCIGKFGEVKDNASPHLMEIRRSLAEASGSLQRNMRRVMERIVKQGIVDSDISPTLRDGRMVIPIPAGKKRELSGIVHDQSATGKTIFIEPAEVVEAGNRLRSLEFEEQKEIHSILSSLGDMVRPYIPEIGQGCFLHAKIDFIRAKARFATDTGGQMPVMENNRELEWYHAVHPLLLLNLRKQGKEPVPLYITLTDEKRILIISGPNAGGKSVCLKTVATVQYMYQCGILPTLHSNSHMGVFSKIFIDIGDEQSIENDLSTYSSHLSNMKYILKEADSKSLILADEMGSGTEPQIGGALAQAILTELGHKKCKGVVTTHYQNLKTFADAEPGFVNGAMLYDRQHLKPTFQLSIGSPGSSFALEIARNIGLPKNVIEMAGEIVGSEYVDIDKYLLDIQRDRKYWQNKRLNIKEKEHKLDKLVNQYETTLSDLASQKGLIIKAAKAEALEIMQGANARIERSIHEIKKAEAEKERTKEIRRELEDYKKNIQNIDENDTQVIKHQLPKRKNKVSKTRSVNKSAEINQTETLQVGDTVKMKDGSMSGSILSIDGKRAEVAFGSVRTFVELNRLEKSTEVTNKKKENKVNVVVTSEESRERQLKFKNEIDVRGMRADEAVQAVTYFIDDAIQFGVSRIRILHGTGHGILRTLIREQLRSNPNIKDFHDEDVRMGGAGITVVNLE